MKQAIFIGILYGLSFMMLKYSAGSLSTYYFLLFFIGVLAFTGVLNFFSRFVDITSTDNKNYYSLNKGIYLYLILSVSIICIQPFAWKNIAWLAHNIDPATFVFFLFLPAIWLLRFKFAETARVASIFLVMIPILLIAGYDSMAEAFAIITYLFLGAMTVEELLQK